MARTSWYTQETSGRFLVLSPHPESLVNMLVLNVSCTSGSHGPALSASNTAGLI